MARPFEGKGVRMFKSTPQGTLVTWRFEIETRGFLALIGPLFGVWKKKAMEKDLTLAKNLLESAVRQQQV